MISSLLSFVAEPNGWPLLGPADASSAALLVIDMQGDFLREGGWFGGMGFDLGDMQRVVPVVAELLRVGRALPGLHIVQLGEERPKHREVEEPAQRRSADLPIS